MFYRFSLSRSCLIRWLHPFSSIELLLHLLKMRSRARVNRGLLGQESHSINIVSEGYTENRTDQITGKKKYNPFLFCFSASEIVDSVFMMYRVVPFLTGRGKQRQVVENWDCGVHNVCTYIRNACAQCANEVSLLKQ